MGIAENDLLIIIQGTGINIDKGAEELIDAVNISDGVSLLVAGSGDVVPELKDRVSDLKIGYKVKFIPAVNWETLMKYTRSADLGMCIEKDTNINYRFSLPNKLFDYLSAGLPVIASKLPETEKIISENSCGIIIEAVTPELISEAVLLLKNNPAMLEGLKRNAVKASLIINWDLESIKVKDLYTNVLSREGNHR